MPAASLIDTNVLVYRFDPRFPQKQAIATRLLREGLRADSLRIPHQAPAGIHGRSDSGQNWGRTAPRAN